MCVADLRVFSSAERALVLGVGEGDRHAFTAALFSEDAAETIKEVVPWDHLRAQFFPLWCVLIAVAVRTDFLFVSFIAVSMFTHDHFSIYKVQVP